MKRVILLLISVIQLANVLMAQKYDNDEMKFAFGFNIGKGQPMRDYGNITQAKLPMSRITGQDTNKISGYAQLGFHYNFYVTYKLMRHLNIMLALNGDINSYDLNALSLQYNSLFPPNITSVYTPTEYRIMQYLIGPKYNLPVSKNVSVEFKALVGITTNNYPPSLTFNRVKDTVIYYYSAGKGFGYNLGVGIKYNLETGGNFGVGFHLNLSYAGSEIKYPNYSVTTLTPFATSTYDVPKSMALGILQLTVGVSFEFFPPKSD
ncbi:MAG: hypothetical protein ACYDCN_02120 [Bacteroidia bacterium]